MAILNYGKKFNGGLYLSARSKHCHDADANFKRHRPWTSREEINAKRVAKGQPPVDWEAWDKRKASILAIQRSKANRRARPVTLAPLPFTIN